MKKFMFVFMIIIPLPTYGAPPQLNDFLVSKGYIEILLTQSSLGHLEIRGEINGIKGTFLLDTGASSSVLDSNRSGKFRLSKTISATTAGGLGTSSQQAENKIAKSLSIGDYQLQNHKLDLVDLSAMNKFLVAQGAEAQDGVIGADILRPGNGVIDYKNAILYLKKSNIEDCRKKDLGSNASCRFIDF